MKVTSFQVVGPISENADFLHRTFGSGEIVEIDFSKMTFINSIGVKNWTTWAYKIPLTTSVNLLNCPFVLMNQASLVHGFLPKNFFVTSFFATYFCDDCSFEKNVLFLREIDFQYKTKTEAAWTKIPESVQCTKCKGPAEQDFNPAKITNIINAN